MTTKKPTTEEIFTQCYQEGTALERSETESSISMVWRIGDMYYLTHCEWNNEGFTETVEEFTPTNIEPHFLKVAGCAT